MEAEKFNDLLVQSIEHERGSVDIYQTALKCALRDDLEEEWTRCVSHIRTQELTLTEACRKLSINPEQMTLGREVNKYLGESLVSAMELAYESGKPQEAKLIACECITLAETMGHSNWQLIAQCAANSTEEQKQVLSAAVGQVEGQVNDQLYRARGWARALYVQSLGIESVLPPLDEGKRDAQGDRRA